MIKTKIALAAALFAAATSASFAQAAQARVHKQSNAHLQSEQALQQRNVSLPTEGRSPAGPFYYNLGGPTTGGM